MRGSMRKRLATAAALGLLLIVAGVYLYQGREVVLPGGLRARPWYRWPSVRMVFEAQSLPGSASQHPVVYELYWQEPGRWFVQVIDSEDPNDIGTWRMYDGARAWPGGQRVRRLVPGPITQPTRANAVATLVLEGKARQRGTETVLGVETQVVDIVWAEHDVERHWIDPLTGVVMVWEQWYRGERAGYMRVLEIEWNPDVPENLFDPPERRG